MPPKKSNPETAFFRRAALRQYREHKLFRIQQKLRRLSATRHEVITMERIASEYTPLKLMQLSRQYGLDLLELTAIKSHCKLGLKADPATLQH